MKYLPITSPANPRIKQVLHLRKQRQRRQCGLFLAEGPREVGRALAAGLKAQDIFYCPQQLGVGGEQLLKRLPEMAASQAAVFEVPASLMLKMSYRDDPEGVLGVFEPPVWELAHLAPGTGAWGRNELWLVAEGTEKPGNLGAMARSAAAAGARGLLAVDAEVDAFNPNAIRASTGAVFTLPIVEVSAAQAIEFLHQRGVQLIVASPQATRSYDQVDLRPAVALVVGAEDRGLSKAWASIGQAVNIPMQAGVVDSLNASTAAAVLLFEAARQRRAASAGTAPQGPR